MRVTTTSHTRRVVLAGFDDFQALDLVGPAEVFAMAARIERDGYSTEVVASRGDAITASNGLRIGVDRTPTGARGPIDTLVVVGGNGVPAALEDRGLVSWIERSASRARRVTSVCNGAFLLARAGLLDGRRATTHWSACATLQ